MSSYFRYPHSDCKPMDPSTLTRTVFTLIISTIITILLIAFNYPISVDSPLIIFVFISGITAFVCLWAIFGHLVAKFRKAIENKYYS